VFAPDRARAPTRMGEHKVRPYICTPLHYGLVAAAIGNIPKSPSLVKEKSLGRGPFRSPLGSEAVGAGPCARPTSRSTRQIRGRHGDLPLPRRPKRAAPESATADDEASILSDASQRSRRSRAAIEHCISNVRPERLATPQGASCRGESRIRPSLGEHKVRPYLAARTLLMQCSISSGSIAMNAAAQRSRSRARASPFTLPRALEPAGRGTMLQLSLSQGSKREFRNRGSQAGTWEPGMKRSVSASRRPSGPSPQPSPEGRGRAPEKDTHCLLGVSRLKFRPHRACLGGAMIGYYPRGADPSSLRPPATGGRAEGGGNVWVALLAASPRLHRRKVGGGHLALQGGHFRWLKCYEMERSVSASRRPSGPSPQPSPDGLIFAHMLRGRRAERGVGPVSPLRGKAKAATPRRTP